MADPFTRRDHTVRVADIAARTVASLESRPLPLTVEAHRWRNAARLLRDAARTLEHADGATDLHAEVTRAEILLEYLRESLAAPYADDVDVKDLDTGIDTARA
jgi:hypothetical protein